VFINAAYSNGVLSVSLSNPPPTGAPTGALVQVAGQDISVPLSNSQGSVPITVHPSVAGWSIPATVSATGGAPNGPYVPPAVINLGNPFGATGPLQCVPPSTTGGTWTIYPTQRSVVRTYHFGLTDPSTALDVQTGSLLDLYTTVSIMLHFLVVHVVPALSQQVWEPTSLSTNEVNALQSMTQAIIPALALTLANVHPAGGTAAEAYSELQARISQYQQAVQAYQQDVASIPNLT